MLRRPQAELPADDGQPVDLRAPGANAGRRPRLIRIRSQRTRGVLAPAGRECVLWRASMMPRSLWKANALLGLLVALGLLQAAGPVAAAADQVVDCRVEFGPDMLGLRSAVGEAMGQPTGCETAVDAIGDTMQPTSTGMAWYAPRTAASIFTDGFQRWELDVRGLTYWHAPDAAPLLMDGLPEGPAAWSRNV